MKLLFLAHRIPYPPTKGDKIRSYNEMMGFIERGHEVHLLAFADDQHDLNYQAHLELLCASVQVVALHRHTAKLRAISNLITRRPLSLGYFASRKMQRLVEQSIAQHDFDAVFVYSSTMAQYVPRGFSSRTIVDLVDVDSEKWRDYARYKQPPKSWLYELEWKRLHRYEQEIVRRFAYTILTTQREASLLDELDEFTRRARLRVITNGVDSDYFQTGDGTVISSIPRLVFIGAMDYYANIEGVCWFVEEVFPLIREREPQAEFFIIGSNPAREVIKLGERNGVTVTGFVDDVRPFLREATVCVIPLRIARGVQNKVLQAMAAGKAIVATPEAVAGLQVEDGKEMLLARRGQDFAEAILRIIREEPLRAELASQALRYVEAEHNWEPLLKRLIELVESVAFGHSGKTGANPRAIARKGF
ncbi:MAG: TIGR03087 family PEP-CTERM/XrtA system glycosyltransferase [Acidobacteria bacterium]|nr:TIGR03087 family PEP-CTERM/XrtA system glycosyltransferase [Acidobacteriota bacterium]